MALQKFMPTGMAGFNTSTAGAVGHHRVAYRINNAIDVFEALNKDTSRTRSEKAVMYKQLQEKHGRAIKADYELMGKELLQRTENYEQQVEKVLTSVSLADAVQIVAGLKAAGLKADQLMSAVADSKEIAVAMARVPQALSGMTPEISKAAAIKHYPQLVELGEENQRDFSSYSSLGKVVDSTILQIGMSVDEIALAKRFNPEALNPEPQAKTQADVNAMMAKVDNSAFEQATNEQIAEHVGMYGSTYAGPKPSGK